MTNRFLIAAVIMAGILSFFLLYISRETTGPDAETDLSQAPVPDIIRLKFGHHMPENTSQHLSALRYADGIDYKSNGRVKIEVYPDRQLGTDSAMIEMARTGKLAITLPPAAALATLVPEMQVLDLPFLFPDRTGLYEILDGEPGQLLLEKLEPYGLAGASFWEVGFKQFTAGKPIQTPADFNGLNIRVMQGRPAVDIYRLFGANPVSIDDHELYGALKEGRVDGQENSLLSIFNMNIHQIQSHVTVSNHAYLAQVMVFSKAVMDSLPPDVREMLVTTAGEIAAFERNDMVENEKRLISAIRASGTRVSFLGPEEQARFRQAVAPLMSELERGPGGEVLAMIRRHLAQKHRTRADEVVLGLNADVSASSGLSGQAIKRGMELAATKINRDGGVLGKEISIVVRDNSGISDRGRDNMTYFSGLDNLLAVMGGIYSPIALAELDIIHREQIIFLNPWAAATGIVDNGYSPNYVFRVSVRDEYAGPFLIGKALEKSYNIALLLVNDGWGKGNRKTMVRTLAEQSLEPATIQHFNWGEKDMTPQLDLIEKSGAGIIVMVAGVSEGATIIKNMAARDKRLPIISHWGITGGDFWKSVNRELKSVDLSFLQSFSFFNAGNEPARALMADYFKAYGVDHPGRIFAPVGTAHAYDLVHLIAMAVEKAGTLDRRAVRDSLEQLDDHKGVVKHYRPPFTPDRHDALDQSSFILCRYSEQGYIIPITEAELP